MDSSDDECGPSPLGGRGEKSLQAIIDHAVEDNAYARQITKNLTYSKGRPREIRRVHL